MEHKYIQSAKIVNTSLGGQEKGPCFCVDLTLELSEGGGVLFGGFALDEYSPSKKKRIATRIGFQAIMDLMETLEVDSWEELKGRYIRAEFDSPNCSAKILGVGHLMKNRWFSFKEFFEQAKEVSN